VQWSITTDGAIYGAPAVANGVVYVPAGNSVYAFATYGSLLWKAKAGGTVDGAIVTDGTVTASVCDGTLIQYTVGGAGAATTTAAPSRSQLHPNSTLRTGS
jgi:hypothetical protein